MPKKVEFRNRRTGSAVRATIDTPYTVPATLGQGGDQVDPVVYTEGPPASITLPPKISSPPSIDGTGKAGSLHKIVGFAFSGAGTLEYQWERNGLIVSTGAEYTPPSAGLLIARVRKVGPSGAPSRWAECSKEIEPGDNLEWSINGSLILKIPVGPNVTWSVSGSRVSYEEV